MKTQLRICSLWLSSFLLCGLNVQAQVPIYEWSGGFIPKNTSGECTVEKTALDGSGNLYITGYFKDTVDFDPGPGTVNMVSAQTSSLRFDIFVCKLNVNGALVWVKKMGGNGHDQGQSIALDGSGNVYVTGNFQDTADFDPGTGTATLTSTNVFHDIFVSKLDANGNYIWARRMGGKGVDVGSGVDVDGSGNVYTTGRFMDTADFDPGSGTAKLTSYGDFDIFVSKLDANGAYIWARSMGGVSSDVSRGMDVDGSGNVYTTGFYNFTVDFDPGPGSALLGGGGGFVSKLDSSGTHAWVARMGYEGLAIAADGSGNVYTTGVFTSPSDDFDPGPGTATLNHFGANDIFVSKLDMNGAYVWAKSMGSSVIDIGSAIAVDGSGNVYTTGSFQGSTFAPGPGMPNLTGMGGPDVFVSMLNASGTTIWARSIGGTGNDRGVSIAVDGGGNVYTTGNFQNTVDCDPSSDTANLSVSSSNCQGSFVTKWEQAVVGVSGIPQGVLAVYPNPTTGVVVLKFPIVREGATIIITDFAGKTVATQTLARGSAATTSIDLSGFAKGIYIIKARDGEQNYRSLIVAQ